MFCNTSSGYPSWPKGCLAPLRVPSLLAATMAAPELEYISVSRDVRIALAEAGVRLIELNTMQMRQAVLIRVFSGRADLAVHWVRIQQERQNRWKPGLAVNVTPELLERWRRVFIGDLMVQRCVADPAAALAGEVREFLVESLLAEKVRELTAMGLQVPSGFVLNKFMSMLAALPRNPVIEARLSSLRSSSSSCKKWSMRFRQTWSLTWGRSAITHGVSQTGIERRGLIFMRWLRFWHNHWALSPDVVVVNMDETMLGSIQAHKVGIVDARSESGNAATSEIRRERGLRRVSLMASVCSHGDVQKVLPQIRLPFSPAGRVPSRRVMDDYAAAGSPQIAWHGSAGWVARPSLIWYLKIMAAAVRRARPGAEILLVWDACRTHLCGDVLAVARRLRIGIVFIPARLTWALQPLDTHVFAVLKKRIRDLEFQEKADTCRSCLAPGCRVRLHGQAIREVLVDTCWARVLERAGLVRHCFDLRPFLQGIVGARAAAPGFPSVAELMDVLALPEPKALEISRLLLPVPRPAVREAGAAASSGASGAAASVPPAADARRSRVIATPLVLARSARLPPRVGGGSSPSNVWLPFFAGRTVQTRSMTAAAAASASATASDVALRPAKRARLADS